MRVILLRHGERADARRASSPALTEWIHPADAPLTQTGHAQAIRTRSSILRGIPLHALYTSPLLRCVQTAAALACATDGNTIPIDPNGTGVAQTAGAMRVVRALAAPASYVRWCMLKARPIRLMRADVVEQVAANIPGTGRNVRILLDEHWEEEEAVVLEMPVAQDENRVVTKREVEHWSLAIFEACVHRLIRKERERGVCDTLVICTHSEAIYGMAEKCGVELLAPYCCAVEFEVDERNGYWRFHNWNVLPEFQHFPNPTWISAEAQDENGDEKDIE